MEYPESTFARFTRPLIAVLLLLVVGVTGYRLIEGMSLVDALYMTVITLSTVGFGEVRPLSPPGRLFTVGLILTGAGVAAYALNALTTMFLSQEWRKRLAARRQKRMLANLKDHYIVCGYGRVGRSVVATLEAEHVPYVVIDVDAERLERVKSLSGLPVLGNAASEACLREAGIERARGLAAAVDADAENVFITLTARGLRPDIYIVARSNYEESESKMLRAGANRVISPYSISGRRMATMLFRPEVVDFLDEVMHTGGVELAVDQVSIAPSSPLAGLSLAEAQARQQLGVTVLACRVPGQPLNTRPRADTRLDAGVQIFVLGTQEDLQELVRLASGPA